MSEQIIDSIIRIAEEQESSAHGSNKKCFLIDDYALLKQSFTTDEVEQIMSVTEELEKKGVSVARTLSYKVMNQSVQSWNTSKEVLVSEGYVLQQRAQGTPLLDRTNWNEENKRYQIDYLRQIDSISREGQGFFDNFVNGWMEIQKSGIRIDPSKPGNFIYEPGKGITFIDLGLSDHETDISTQVYEQIAVILNLGTYYKCYPEIQQAVEKRLSIIIDKYRNAVLEHGIDSSIVDGIIETKTPRTTAQPEQQIEETPEEEFARLEEVIDGHINEENLAREEARRIQAEREEKARIERQRKEEEARRLEEEEERKNGGKRYDSKMYAVLNGLMKDGIIPEDKLGIFQQVFRIKTNIYKDLSPELFRKHGTTVDLKSIIPNLEGNNIKIDMKSMQLKPEGEITNQDYEQMTTVVQDYFRQYFEKIANNSDSKLLEYSKMKEMHESGVLTEEQYIEFKLLESELTEFSQAQELFSYFGIQDENVFEQSKRISGFLQKQNEVSEEDRAKQESRKREIDREYLDAVFRDTGITDPEELRRLYEGQDEIRVSEEDLEIVLASFSEPKTMSPSQMGKSAAKVGTGLIDINSTTQEIRQDLQPSRKAAKGLND